MKFFAIAVFVLHSLAEITFGVSNFLSGSSSSLTPEQTEALTGAMVNSYRFLGVALFSLGLLGLAVIFGPGVQSVTGWLVAGVLMLFHALGCVGVFMTNAAHPGLLGSGFAQGALAIHGVLAVGFLIVFMTLRARV